MKANKPTATPNFHFIVVRLAAKFFCRKSSPKIIHFRRRFFRQKKKSSFKAILKDIPWYLYGIFSVSILAWHASAISLEPFWHISTWLVPARKGFWVIQSYRERRTLPIPISKILLAKYCIHWFFYKSNLAQIALIGPGIRPLNDQRDDFTREPPSLLWSMFGLSVSLKPPLTSVFFERLAFTHHIPA